jgi:hypothetical protein
MGKYNILFVMLTQVVKVDLLSLDSSLTHPFFILIYSSSPNPKKHEYIQISLALARAVMVRDGTQQAIHPGCLYELVP